MPESISDYYNFDEEVISQAFLKHRPKKVLVQLPEGLKHFYPTLLEKLENISEGLGLHNIEFHIDASPIYGSCLMDLTLTSRHDLVLHFGHKEYPYWSPPQNVVLIDLQYKGMPTSQTIQDLVRELVEEGVKRVGIYGTAQHDIGKIAEAFKREGIDVANDASRAVIFGCWYSDLPSLQGAEAYIIVAGGEFHALGAGLALGGTGKIYALDPYTNSYSFMNPYIEKILRKRYYLLMKAEDMSSFVIIAGICGQFRPAVINRLKSLIQSKRLKYTVAEAPYVTKEALGNLDNPYVDAFIVTSCPRLPIDDLSDYHKPVLTPGEAFMVLEGSMGRYIYPW
ncbi:MAG: diphthamide biosynthesis enzyme Dph2 [Desulfurococcales archaeon]|nr:diphthamide biosynthesis enzyme Dph2 [Desulfurococcales archaeon]